MTQRSVSFQEPVGIALVTTNLAVPDDTDTTKAVRRSPPIRGAALSPAAK